MTIKNTKPRYKWYDVHDPRTGEMLITNVGRGLARAQTPEGGALGGGFGNSR